MLLFLLVPPSWFIGGQKLLNTRRRLRGGRDIVLRYGSQSLMIPAMISVPQTFAHLQVHSHYTLLGATLSLETIVDRAKAENTSALALTDENALYGAVAFTRLCQREGIKPIIGMTVAVAVPADELMPQAARPGRLVLLADGPSGYRSLCRISSILQSARPERALYGSRTLAWEALRTHNEGLLCLSGGRQGWVERFLRAGRADAAARFAARLGGLFQERCFISIWPANPDDAVASELTALGERFGLPTVAARPILCARPEEAPRLQLLAALKNNCKLDELAPEGIPPAGESSGDWHWPQRQELSARFAGHPEALERAGQVVTRCKLGLPDGRAIWPVLPLPAGQDPAQALALAARTGFQERYGHAAAATTADRLQAELAAITAHGFAPLFLLVADIVRFARQADIPVSTRGSVANSLVAHCLGITEVDPLAHDLLFERFLNPARTSMPDIDLDFCSRRRDEVLNYIREVHGAERVALVSTMSTLGPRSAVREVAKAFGLDDASTRLLVALAPRRWHPDPRRRASWDIAQSLENLPDARSREALQEALALVGQPDHLSIHPGGLVVTPGPLTDILPVERAPKGFLVTQYGYKDLEAIGLPKVDLLGIRALTVLADAAGLVRQHHEAAFRIVDIDLTDEQTAALLATGDTIGVFQCESSGARRTLRQLRARTVRDLAVANAFFKPGPATGGMAQSFVRRYRGLEPVHYLHPALEPILAPTKGVLIFQEQILRIAREIAGLSWTQADALRKGMSKFQEEEMAALTEAFMGGCRREPPEGPGLTPAQAQTLWEQVLAFAGYGFNQGHATAYADVSFRSAYLKAHYPAEFLGARLADRGGFHHPAIYMAEARRLGIAVRPPHINASDRAFTLTYGSPLSSPTAAVGEDRAPILWMGLGQVRSLRRKSAGAIVAERRQRLFRDVGDLLARVPLQEKEVRHLIQCGALDGLGYSRQALLAEAALLQRAGSNRQLAFSFAANSDAEPEAPHSRLEWEKAILGMPVSVHPVTLLKRGRGGPLDSLRTRRGQETEVYGVRLPGWTGGKGFFLGDEHTYVEVIPAGEIDPAVWRQAWRPLLVRGRWSEDEWGGGWLQASSIVPAS